MESDLAVDTAQSASRPGTHLLRAVPAGWFTWDYEIWDGEEIVTRLRTHWLKETGSFELGGHTHEISREGWWGDFVLAREEEALCRATKPGIFSRSFRIHLGEETLDLESTSMWGNKFVLKYGESKLGTIETEGTFTLKSRIALPGDLPLAVRLFTFWLVAILWRREMNAAASG